MKKPFQKPNRLLVLNHNCAYNFLTGLEKQKFTQCLHNINHQLNCWAANRQMIIIAAGIVIELASPLYGLAVVWVVFAITEEVEGTVVNLKSYLTDWIQSMYGPIRVKTVGVPIIQLPFPKETIPIVLQDPSGFLKFIGPPPSPWID